MKAIVMTLLAFSSLAAGDGPKTDDVKKEAEKLRGDYTLTKMVRDGQDLTGQMGEVEVVFEVDSFRSPGIEATFKLDPSKTPKAIDITYKEGPAAGQTVKGIYKLEGDTLAVCRALAEKDDRPNEFDAPKGSGRFLFVFKRAKTK
jgi:uncharacterized protein (TIGR03067 family)